MDHHTATAVDRAQNLRALQLANRVRSARAQVKRHVGTGELTAAEAILSHRWEIEGMPIAELLRSQPGWGARRCQRFLAALAMDERKTIGSMTERQRSAAAAHLAGAQPTRRLPTHITGDTIATPPCRPPPMTDDGGFDRPLFGWRQ